MKNGGGRDEELGNRQSGEKSRNESCKIAMGRSLARIYCHKRLPYFPVSPHATQACKHLKADNLSDSGFCVEVTVREKVSRKAGTAEVRACVIWLLESWVRKAREANRVGIT